MFKFFKKTKDAADNKPLKDSVCGMRASDNITLKYKDRVYRFCSDHCKQKFEKNPECYIAK